jgi:hypothetical protein
MFHFFQKWIFGSCFAETFLHEVMKGGKGGHGAIFAPP